MAQHAIDNAKAWWENIKEMVAAMDKAREDGSDDDYEKTIVAITESVLCVEVRDGWRTPGAETVGNPAEEYSILLTTGGPALRIYGHLNRYSEPDDFPVVQWQDWGTQWTDWHPEPDIGVSHEDNETNYRDVLRTFASQFYFGE